MSERTPVESRYARDLYPEHNAVVAGWMADHGFPVTKAPESLTGEIFAWIHEGGSDSRYALRITREALDYIAPSDLERTLDLLHTDRALRDSATGAVAVHFDKQGPRLIASP
jgi:hypothetical protein